MDSSDDTRRSMKDALSDEAQRFLRPRDTSKDRDPERVTAAPQSRPPTPVHPPPADSQSTSMARKRSPSLSVVVPAIVSMTFRLPAPLAGQLVGVATERKLQRERPFTQQDIVVEALRQWFMRNSYVEHSGR